MRLRAEHDGGCIWEDDWPDPQQAACEFAEDRVKRGKDCSPVTITVYSLEEGITKGMSWKYEVIVTPREGYDCEATLLGGSVPKG